MQIAIRLVLQLSHKPLRVPQPAERTISNSHVKRQPFFILLDLKFELDFQSNNSQEHEIFSHSAAYQDYEVQANLVVPCPRHRTQQKHSRRTGGV